MSSVEAIDVSEHLTKVPNKPKNFQLHISGRSDIPVASDSIDVAFSNQLMERFHCEVAKMQLRRIYRALPSGEQYICVTPNRASEPHNVSKYFDDVVTCFHLKEYTVSELAGIFFQTGFSRMSRLIKVKGKFFPASKILLDSLESIVSLVRGTQGRKLIHSSLTPVFVGNIYIIGLKK